MIIKYPCIICLKNVYNNQNALLCVKCTNWCHLTCSRENIDVFLSIDDWICPKCYFNELPGNIFTEEKNVKSHNNSSGRSQREKINIDAQLESFHKFDVLREKGLKCVQLNIVSLLKNFDELKSILFQNDIHVCALNETRLDAEIDDTEVSISGYSLIRKDRNRNGGGVAIYIQNNIDYKVLEDQSLLELEAILIMINITNSQPILFMNWYRPPSSRRDTLFAYENVLIFMNNFNSNSIIVGDTNFDIFKKPLISQTKYYDQLNTIHGLYYINTTKCTRITSDTATLIDHMLTNDQNKIKASGVIDVCMGDHYMNYLIWKSPNLLTHAHNLVTFRKSKGVDLDAFRNDLKNINWSDVENVVDIDDSAKNWEAMILSVINNHMPLRTKRMRKQCSPWLNESIFNLMKERDKVKKKAIVKQSNELWTEYRRLRNRVTYAIKKAKKQHYTNKLLQCTNRNDTWKVLKSFLPKNNVSPSHACTDLFNKASRFNDHFANVVTELLKKHQDSNCGENEFHSTINDAPCPNKLKLSVVSEADVMREINKLKNKKSCGVDGITVQVLKSCVDILIKPITYLINKSITDGKVPIRWKIAKVIPLHKKGDKSNPDNYRPISLLPCISKVLERIIQIQLVSHLHANNILDSMQSGFRARHSTVTALVKVTDDWLMAMDEGRYTGAVFVDLQKAFDTVDHQVLLNKLYSIGLDEMSLQWFESYLSERRIVTMINNVMSNERVLTHGVPQGSLLGPLLFTIFINDLPKIFNLCHVHLYADDTVIYFSHKCPTVVESVLNDEMEYLDKWMSRNKLLINYTKTVTMLIGTRHKLSKCNVLNVKIRDTNIVKVDSTKYLGINIDNELKWDAHINIMCQKISKLIGFLGRLRHIINESDLNLIYKSIIIPHFDYGDMVWQSATKSSLSLLQKLQNWAGRVIMKVNPYSHTSNQHVHDTLNWDFLDCRYKKHVCTMIFKILNNYTPSYMSNNIKYRTYNYSFRSSRNLDLPKPNSNNCKRTFFYRGATQYNQIPEHIRNVTTLRSFHTLITDIFS